MIANMNTDGSGIRLLPVDGDEAIFEWTATAAYQLGSLTGAHRPDGYLSESMLDAQQMAVELRKHTGHDVGDGIVFHADTVVAAALATEYRARFEDDINAKRAADVWREIVQDLEFCTDRDAQNAWSDPTTDVPDDPWIDAIEDQDK